VTADALLRGLPGEALIRDGVRDVLEARHTIPALVVSVARERLIGADVLPRSAPQISTDPERELYRMLLAGGGDAYSRYNALIRELTSFVSSLEARASRNAATQKKRPRN